HTSCLSDWSSDVCSSDLRGNQFHQLVLFIGQVVQFVQVHTVKLCQGRVLEGVRAGKKVTNEAGIVRSLPVEHRHASEAAGLAKRSEERRVGEEGRVRAWP